mgnify:CR=1 FL=1
MGEENVVTMRRTDIRVSCWFVWFGVIVVLLTACASAATNPLSQPGLGEARPKTAVQPPLNTTPASQAPTDMPDPAMPQPRFLHTSALQFGVVAHLYYTDRSRVLMLTKIAGFDWVRQQVHWKDIEAAPGVYYWDELDNIVADVSASDLKLLVNVVQSPSFYPPGNGGKPRDPRVMGNFVAAMVERYGDRIAAIEIWNEPNLAVENGGRVTPEDPGRYVEILAECYRRIKAINPNIYVLAAAPASTGVFDPERAIPDIEYLRAMYTYKDGMIRDYFDAQAVHPGGAANSPDWLYPETPGNRPGWNDHPTHYFRHVENVRALMVEHGLSDRQIWITEYGWATPNTTPGFEFGNLMTFEDQANYIVRAITRVYEQYRDAEGRPWVGAMFLWNMNFAVLWGAQGNPNHEQASFGLLNPDWSPRPAFIALQGLHQRLKAAQEQSP